MCLKTFHSKILIFCCSELFRRPAERALPARIGVGAAIRLSIVGRNVPLGWLGDVGVTATPGGDTDVDVDVDVVVLVDSGGGGGNGSFNGANGEFPCESADASAARDPWQIVPGRDSSATEAAVDSRRHIRLSLCRPDNLPRQHDFLRVVGQRNVASSTGTVNGTARTSSASVAVFRPAISSEPRCRRHGRRVDLVAGSNERVP